MKEHYMKFIRSLSAVVLCGSLTYASSLAVYQDNTFYTFTPQNNFIGFTNNVKAKFEGTSLPLSLSSECPSNDRLCKVLESWKSAQKQVDVVKANSQILQKLISLPQPTTFDAASWIESAKRLGEEQARLASLEKSLMQEANILQAEFQKQAPSKLALSTSKACAKEIELTIPRGAVSFSTHYEADVKDEEVTVTQYLSVINRSGIDINAENAMFFYRSSHQYVYPVHFTPWIVSKYEPRPEKVYKSSMVKRKSMAMPAMADEMMERAITASAPVASYEDAREYKIKDLSLPSTGTPVEVKVLSWKTDVACDIRSYPYEETKVFEVCSFEPKYQIDSNRWKVRASGNMINENAVGEYKEKKYDLYTKVEEDIQIKRKRIVNKERETGIFGGNMRKKDGFIITLINKSEKSKELTVIERIPTSTSDEIKSKLLSINSNKKVDYKMLEDGQIEMKLTLAPLENKKIEVLFEISHDKEIKVDY